jgi:type IV secretory pathway VirB6-like protein
MNRFQLGNMLNSAKEHFQQRENADTDNTTTDDNNTEQVGKLLGMGVGMFFSLLIIQIVLWIMSIVMAAKHGVVYVILAILAPWIVPIPFITPIIVIVIVNSLPKQNSPMYAPSPIQQRAPSAFGY